MAVRDYARDFSAQVKVMSFNCNMVDNMAMASSKESDFEKILEYKIFKCSSFSSTFVPDNILVDKPTDLNSRWSTDNDNNPQYIILKLQRTSIVKSITFGKFEKAHVCNVKKFRVFGGLDSQHMMELFEGGLKNDSYPETFDLRCTMGDKDNYFPVRYIKIILLQSWGPNMNCSIWHVHLTGIDDTKIVKPCIEWFNKYRQNELSRLCMKHFRKCRLPQVVHIIGKMTGAVLEDPQLTLLYQLLVDHGDYSMSEKLLASFVKDGLLNEYIKTQMYQVLWSKISSPDPKPGMRGGHQMVIDSVGEVLYLFGGWDGNQDLADLWVYNISTAKWSLICKDASAVGGPSPRSCHKMCLDPGTRQLFILGRYLDNQLRNMDSLKSDFYVYNIDSNQWTLISEDTAAVGGPELIFDHQMVMDVEKRTIYVFGGRVLVLAASPEENTTNINESIFSGLYSYHVPTGTWTKLACDISKPNNENIPLIRSRVGHSMLFHPTSRKLYIFAGQRGKDYMNDFFTYDVDTNRFENVSLNDLGNKEISHIPAAGFTQRATIDPELGEIYVLSGLSKDKDKRDENVQNSFWVYNIKNNKWTCIYRNENMGEKYWSKMQNYEPCPRFAHQLVYDHVKKVHYLFGGNPGRTCLPKLRLDDFWQLSLCRPSHDQILQKCILILRKHKFEELAMQNSFEALEYLQTKISEIVDHQDVEQTKEFQSLAAVLFREPNSSESDSSFEDEQDLTDLEGIMPGSSLERAIYIRRIQLYDKLTEFFSESMTQPRANLVDLLPL